MADIFISYANEDREQARLLATFLEAEGYSVWWDTSLLSGENFRKAIMTELGRARATIVIWTEHSIHSDWVASEAGRAHADRKLIPVKARGLAYKDIPPPFDNMHIENVDDREKILAALVAQLAKPEVQPSKLERVSKAARYELLSWFGIAGAALTLVANLQSVLLLAKWVSRLFDAWTWLLKIVWRHIFFFLPRIDAIDAMVLTSAAFMAMNVIMSSRRASAGSSFQPRRHSRISLTVAILLVMGIFWIGWRSILSSLLSDPGYYYYFIEILIDYYRDVLLRTSFGVFDPLVRYAYVFLLFYVLPLLPFAVLLFVVMRLTSLRIDTAILTRRLWRIVVAVGLLVLLNVLAFLVESALLIGRQDWPRS